ncbi:hypothetical protein I552_6221 [Mycobacterium xenopi 3993]|nr:hypothetical protein I552_6221 [Mycobacterium xenopi 3993]
MAHTPRLLETNLHAASLQDPWSPGEAKTNSTVGYRYSLRFRRAYDVDCTAVEASMR